MLKKREIAASFVAQSLMKVKCKEFEPLDCSEKKIEKYERVHEANKDYLEYHSASSSEIKTCFVSKEDHNAMKEEILELKTLIRKKDKKLGEAYQLNLEVNDENDMIREKFESRFKKYKALKANLFSSKELILKILKE